MPEKPSPSQEPARLKGGWRRPLSYLLLIAGAAGILFNNNLSQATGLSVLLLQIATLGLFIAGAVLFYSVRETTDRVSSYRQVFSAKDKPTGPDPKDPPTSGDSPH